MLEVDATDCCSDGAIVYCFLAKHYGICLLSRMEFVKYTVHQIPETRMELLEVILIFVLASSIVGFFARDRVVYCCTGD